MFTLHAGLLNLCLNTCYFYRQNLNLIFNQNVSFLLIIFFVILYLITLYLYSYLSTLWVIHGLLSVINSLLLHLKLVSSEVMV